MAEAPSPEEVSRWQRRLAAQANNRAWQLAESSSRSPEEDEEMLQAAHAAMYFWKIVGNPDNRARAAQLLAHVYALLELPDPARHYLGQSTDFFREPDREPWEKAMAAAITANVAAAVGDAEAHARNYQLAEQLMVTLPNAQDRQVLNATLRVIPKP